MHGWRLLNFRILRIPITIGMSESRLNDLLDQIHSVIDETEDDVRVYRISGLQAVQQIGRSIFPDGVLVTGSRGGAMGIGQGK